LLLLLLLFRVIITLPWRISMYVTGKNTFTGNRPTLAICSLFAFVPLEERREEETIRFFRRVHRRLFQTSRGVV
jgi:hypothetical protein